MKKILIVFAMLFLQLGVFAQGVPANIEKSFKAKYASVEAVEWASGDTYVASFWIGDFYKEATFSKAGAWLETSTVMEEDALPSTITDALNEQLKGVFITYVVKMEKNDGSQAYIIDLSTDTENLQVTTDNNGKILKKVVLEAAVDGEDDGF